MERRVLGRTALHVAVWLIGLLVAAIVLFPVFARPSPYHHRPTCLPNVKQVGIGLIIYASDEGERLPPAAKWMDSIHPYTKSEDLLHCRSGEEQDVQKYGYALNRHLQGVKLNRLETPAEVPMVYDSTSRVRNASDFVTSLPSPGRHKGRNSMAFADGSAKRLPGSP